MFRAILTKNLQNTLSSNFCHKHEFLSKESEVLTIIMVLHLALKSDTCLTRKTLTKGTILHDQRHMSQLKPDSMSLKSNQNNSKVLFKDGMSQNKNIYKFVQLLYIQQLYIH